MWETAGAVSGGRTPHHTVQRRGDRSDDNDTELPLNDGWMDGWVESVAFAESDQGDYCVLCLCFRNCSARSLPLSVVRMECSLFTFASLCTAPHLNCHAASPAIHTYASSAPQPAKQAVLVLECCCQQISPSTTCLPVHLRIYLLHYREVVSMKYSTSSMHDVRQCTVARHVRRGSLSDAFQLLREGTRGASHIPSPDLCCEIFQYRLLQV